MSEYQYYEFRALDKPLTRAQMAELRAITSRAEITPTSLTNTYEWGDFKGDPVALLTTHFDAHLYDSNWGVRTLMFSFPRSAVDLETLGVYRAEAVADYEAGLMVTEQGGRVIVTFAAYEEEPADWSEDEASEVWLPGLISLRADIANGDLRALYLGWLAGATYGLDGGQADDEDDELIEPPVPAGLAQLSEPLKMLARFLHLDLALVAVAAEASEPLTPVGPSVAALKRWIENLSLGEKDGIVLRLMQGDARLQPELRRRFRQATTPRAQTASSRRRTARDLLKAAAARAAERALRGKEAAARERALRAEEAARARDAHLRSMIGHESTYWRQAEDHIARKQAKEYDRAVEILVDLRDLAAREGKAADFGARIGELRERHASKPSLMERLDRAGLR